MVTARARDGVGGWHQDINLDEVLLWPTPIMTEVLKSSRKRSSHSAKRYGHTDNFANAHTYKSKQYFLFTRRLKRMLRKSAVLGYYVAIAATANPRHETITT
jgi:hypothetical protein